MEQQNIGNEIYYGPHLFSNNPEHYIRTIDKEIGGWKDHGKIIHTLALAFSNKNDQSILPQMAKEFNLDSNMSVNISFINYGNMQMVYLATLGNKSKTTILINQPHIPLGNVRKEYNNLKRLVEIDPHFVIKPFAYFSRKDMGHEMYASEYIDNALCIAIDEEQGFYDPLPKYHFEKFSSEISRKVNSSMISLLVNYYDSEKEKGLSKTQFGGNDFIFTRNFKKDDPSSVQPNIKIIAAREFIDVSLDEYIDMLSQEFLVGACRDDPLVINGQLKINTGSKLPMTRQEIKEGVDLGLKLRRQQKL